MLTLEQFFANAEKGEMSKGAITPKFLHELCKADAHLFEADELLAFINAAEIGGGQLAANMIKFEKAMMNLAEQFPELDLDIQTDDEKRITRDVLENINFDDSFIVDLTNIDQFIDEEDELESN